MKTEGRDVNLNQVTPHVVHPVLHQDYDLDFQMWRVDDIAPTLTSPMLSGLISSVRFIGRPEVPKGPASPKMEEGLGVPAELPLGQMHHAPHVLAGLHLMCRRPKWTSCTSRKGSILMLPEPDPVEVAAVIISDDDTDFPFEMPQAVSAPKVELAWGQKQPLEDRSPRSSPPKKRATEEKEESPPPCEAVLP